MKKIIVIISILFFSHFASAQKFALNVGHNYPQKHTGYTGVEYRIDKNSDSNKQGPLTLGIGAMMYGENGKFKAAPEIHMQKTWMHFVSSQISVSTQNIVPSVGLSFFNLTRLQFGYSFPLQQSNFKGFYVGFHVLIGGKPFYDEITVY